MYRICFSCQDILPCLRGFVTEWWPKRKNERGRLWHIDARDRGRVRRLMNEDEDDDLRRLIFVIKGSLFRNIRRLDLTSLVLPGPDMNDFRRHVNNMWSCELSAREGTVIHHVIPTPSFFCPIFLPRRSLRTGPSARYLGSSNFSLWASMALPPRIVWSILARAETASIHRPSPPSVAESHCRFFRRLKWDAKSEASLDSLCASNFLIRSNGVPSLRLSSGFLTLLPEEEFVAAVHFSRWRREFCISVLALRFGFRGFVSIHSSHFVFFWKSSMKSEKILRFSLFFWI